MEGIIIILIVWAFMKTTAIDVIHAAKGTPSPRWGPAQHRAQTRAHNSQQRVTRRTARSTARSARKAARTAPTFGQIAAEYARGLTHDSAQEVRARHAEKAKLRTERKGVKTQARHEAKVERIRTRPAAARPQWGASDTTPQVRHPLDPDEAAELAQYNDEVSRGVEHSPERVARMQDLQAKFDDGAAPSPAPEEDEGSDRPTPQVSPRSKYVITVQQNADSEPVDFPTTDPATFAEWRGHAESNLKIPLGEFGSIYSYSIPGEGTFTREDTDTITDAEIVEDSPAATGPAAHPASAGASDGVSLDGLINEVADLHQDVSQMQITLEQAQIGLNEVEMKGAAVNALISALHNFDQAEMAFEGALQDFDAQRTIQDRYRAAGEKDTGNPDFYIGPAASN